MNKMAREILLQILNKGKWEKKNTDVGNSGFDISPKRRQNSKEVEVISFLKCNAKKKIFSLIGFYHFLVVRLCVATRTLAF